jgi:8-oxo-dGTP pyrophosphatase MutT (NUDIX family)
MTTMPLQACTVPFRRCGDQLQFCLITSSRGSWIFPKGIVDPGETPEQTALKEAFEEAGLHGQLIGAPLGSYKLPKFDTVFEVVSRLLSVERCDDAWPEHSMRQRQWVTAEEARQLISKPELTTLLNEAVQRLGD